MQVRQQNLDITNFEAELEASKADFAYNVNLARNKFQTAIDEIDKTINHLQKVRDNLVSTDNNFRIANNKVQDLTVIHQLLHAGGGLSLFLRVRQGLQRPAVARLWMAPRP